MAEHDHIFQSMREPVPGCPACSLIRVEVMNAHPHMIRSGMFGSPPRLPGKSAFA